ncbi:MAG: 4'-phosphopantetheinyl transferase superfamily protein [Sphingobacterium sp.]
MVYLFYVCIDQEKITKFITENKTILPSRDREQVASFKTAQSACHFIAGRKLLVHGIDHLGIDHLKLSNLQIGKYNRPFFIDSLSFNISHSGNIVVCILAEKGRLGVDIEQITNIEFSDYSSVFTVNEFNMMKKSSSPQSEFFKYWTRKEAIIKADGRGFNIDPLSFEVIRDEVIVDNELWFLSEVEIASSYCMHIASDVSLNSEVRLEKVAFC